MVFPNLLGAVILAITMIYFLLTLNALLMLILPVLLGIWLVRRYKVSWILFLIGAAGFVLSQLFHIPFNHFVLDPFVAGILDQGQTTGRFLLAALLLGLSAGLFEEVTRYLFYRRMKNTRQWDQGLMFGAGWGGVESIIVGIVSATTIANVYIYQSGLIDTLVPAEQMANNPEAFALAAQQIAELVSSPPWMLLLGAVERVFAIVLHLSLSILVLQVFMRKRLIWLFIAIGWHTLVNAAAVFGTLQEWDVLLIEGIIAVAGVISFLIIRYFKPTAETAELEETPA